MTHGIPKPPLFGEPLPLSVSTETLTFLARRRSTPAPTLRAPAPSPEELNDLLTIAARAPDHGKLAPWRFIVIEGAGKAAYEARLDAIAAARPDAVKLAAKLGKLKAPPMAVAVISRTTVGDIPEWEQLMSAGAVCTNLTYAALAMGYGANWITDWYAYDADALDALDLATGERVAGFVFLGTASEPPLERARPDVSALISRL